MDLRVNGCGRLTTDDHALMAPAGDDDRRMTNDREGNVALNHEDE
jgi:hypothetical protein